MKLWHRSIGISGLLVSMTVTPLILLGCGENAEVTGTETLSTSGLLAEDPLEGVLNSTHGFTPVEPGSRVDRLAEALGLTEEQKQDLLEAYTTFRAGLENLKAQVDAGELTWEEAREQARSLRDTFEAEVQVILTAEQYDQLQEMRASRHGHGRHGRRLGMRWDDWLEQIGASETQVEEVRTALASLHEGMMDLRDQIRTGDLTREEAWQAAQALRDQFDTALQTILTPEQYERLQELRPDCRRHG